jgi:hypothetical protein
MPRPRTIGKEPVKLSAGSERTIFRVLAGSTRDFIELGAEEVFGRAGGLPTAAGTKE